MNNHGGSRPNAGRKKKLVNEVNPQVQIGRHPQEEIDLIDAAAKAKKQTRSQWAWGKLLRAAKKEVSKQ
jgi:hypothetical protein